MQLHCAVRQRSACALSHTTLMHCARAQASQLVKLRAGLVRGVAYAQRQAGEPLYVGGRPADHIALLVKGQVCPGRRRCGTIGTVQGRLCRQRATRSPPSVSHMLLAAYAGRLQMHALA